MSIKEKFEYKIAKEMRKLADKKNQELIDIKEKTDKILKKILQTVEMMAAKGNYNVSYLCDKFVCDKFECNVIENVSQELEKLGFKTRIVDFGENRKSISIKWSSEDYEN